MTVKEIIIEYLTKNGYAGLFNSNFECGCDLENLISCDNQCTDCEAGYKHKCPEGYEFDWLITESKESPNFEENEL